MRQFRPDQTAKQGVKFLTPDQAFTSGKKGEKHAIVYQEKPNFYSSNTGTYDDHILCSVCDQKIGNLENKAIQSLRKIRGYIIKLEHLYNFQPFDGDAFVRFAASICWKYSVTKPEFGQIKLGKYSELLAETAFGDDRIPTSIDTLIVRLFDGSDDVKFYRQPKPDRQLGVNMVRFSLGGFIVFVKIDKRSAPDLLYSSWLRGKSEATIWAGPGKMFEEYRIMENLLKRPDVNNYVRRLRGLP
jgi:hypothetical protein